MNDLIDKHDALPDCDCHSCAIAERTRLQYEASMLMTATSDLLRHFTKTPSSLKDTEARGSAHRAIQRMDKVLRESFVHLES
jgi:hypothetical protein